MGERATVGEIGLGAEEGEPAAWCSSSRRDRNSRRKSLPNTRTGRRKPAREATQRMPSVEMPPPGTIMWTWG